MIRSLIPQGFPFIEHYIWGTWIGIMRSRLGTQRIMYYEDALCASAQVLNIVVPIKQYSGFKMTFEGFLTEPFWYQGSVTRLPDSTRRPESRSNRGPANNMETAQFTIP